MMDLVLGWMEAEFYHGIIVELRNLDKNGRNLMLLVSHLIQMINYLQFLLMEVMNLLMVKFLKVIRLNVKYLGYLLD